MKKSSFLLLAALAILVFQCEKEAPSTPDPVPVESVSETARMNQVLGWKIFNEEQRAKPGENVLISPFSIQTALFMAQNGAEGNTLNQMLELMGCPGCSVSDLNALQRDLTTLLSQQSGHPQLTIANAYFYDERRIVVKPPFLEAIDQFYGGVPQELDFDADQAAVQQINSWVYDHTNGKIDQVLKAITPLDVAFLINALHFKADWASGFVPQSTYQGTFTKADGATIQVDYVNADRNFTTAQTPGFNLVDIPFRDSTYSMSFIQPSAANTNPAWHQSITPQTWKAMYEGMTYERAYVHFPKLKLSYGNDLVQSLGTLGMTDALNPNLANFTAMGTSPTGKNIFIKQVIHKAVLEVDEKGAEGAAVTAVGFAIDSLPPVFHFNSPFILVLRHIPTNTILFMGYVADPEIS